MSIITSLLHANYKENPMTRFFQINKTNFKDMVRAIHVEKEVNETQCSRKNRIYSQMPTIKINYIHF